LSVLPGFLVACAAAVERDGLDGVDVVVLGVGKAAAAAGLVRAVSSNRPAGVLLFGVAGAFPERHREVAGPVGPGAVCLVAGDAFGDEGVQTAAGFEDIAALGLGDCGPFAASVEHTAAAAATLGAPGVRGVTVSTCSGDEATSARMAARSGADVETMEGAAVAEACRLMALPLVQVRAISNWTGDRDRGAWDLPAAVREVQRAVRRLIVPA